MPAFWTVEVVERLSDKVVKEIHCGSSERAAAKAERGVNINLNHEAFYTRLVESHDAVQDFAGLGHERWTCRSCNNDVCLRAPHMSDAEWKRKLGGWQAKHTRGAQSLS